MRAIFTSLIVCMALTACDRQNSATPRFPQMKSAAGMAFDDENGGKVHQDINAENSLLNVSSQLVSTSRDGSEAELYITYSIDPYITPALQPGAYVQFDYVPENAASWVVGRSVIDDQLGGALEVTIPTAGDGSRLVASIGGLQEGVIEDQKILITQLPAIERRNTTDLSRVNQVKAELVDGSYESEVIGQRRVHRFAVKVTDPTAGPIDDLLAGAKSPESINYSITGLDKDAAAHFVALENNEQDIESPVQVSFTEYPLAVYLVIDASKSIVESRQVHNLKNAVASSVLALKQNAQFNIRTFNGQVSRIGGLRELDFDSGASSATAAYYALDTALNDIENHGSMNQDKVAMLFTDGKDRASRNHYNGDFVDNDQVHEYIVQRVKHVREAQQNTFGRQLDVYSIGFYDEQSGIDVSAEVQKLDKIAAAGGTDTSYNNLNASDINDAFATVVQNVRGVYYLQYSSQQTPDNNKLELLVKVNGQEARVALPTQYGK